MKKKNIIPGLIIFAMYSLSFFLIESIRSNNISIEKIDPTPLPPMLLKVIAGEFKGIVADYALLEASSIVGASAATKDMNWDHIAELYKQTIELDPYSEQSLHLIDATLPWFTDKFDLHFSLTEKIKLSRYWDWVPGYFIGFDYLFFLKDYKKASAYFTEASKIEDAPPGLATIAARLANRTGSNDIALNILLSRYKKEENEDTKLFLKKRIDAHIGVQLIEKKINEYKGKFGKNPISILELKILGIIDNLPVHPYGGFYKYNAETDRVEF